MRWSLDDRGRDANSEGPTITTVRPPRVDFSAFWSVPCSATAGFHFVEPRHLFSACYQAQSTTRIRPRPSNTMADNGTFTSYACCASGSKRRDNPWLFIPARPAPPYDKLANIPPARPYTRAGGCRSCQRGRGAGCSSVQVDSDNRRCHHPVQRARQLQGPRSRRRYHEEQASRWCQRTGARHKCRTKPPNSPSRKQNTGNASRRTKDAIRNITYYCPVADM
jgi:hypothetical protein